MLNNDKNIEIVLAMDAILKMQCYYKIMKMQVEIIGQFLMCFILFCEANLKKFINQLLQQLVSMCRNLDFF